MDTPHRENRLLWIALSIGLLIAAATAAWKFTPLADWVTAERIVHWIETFSRYWWAPFALALVYTPACMVLFPRPLLTVAAAMAFGPWVGFAIALGGVLVSTVVGYVAGRQLDRGTVERWGGEKMRRVGKALRKEGLAAVAGVCVVPIAPFFVELLAFGALRLKPWHVLAGVTIANIPGLLASTLLGDQMHAILSDDRSVNVWVVAGVAAMLLLMAFVTSRLWKRMKEATA